MIAADGIANVQRQRMVMGDPVNTQFLTKVNSRGFVEIHSTEMFEILNEIKEAIVDMKWAIINKLG